MPVIENSKPLESYTYTNGQSLTLAIDVIYRTNEHILSMEHTHAIGCFAAQITYGIWFNKYFREYYYSCKHEQVDHVTDKLRIYCLLIHLYML